MAWPDVVALLAAYLDSQMPSDVVVASRVPNPRPAKLLQVRRVGGTKAPPVRDRPRIDLVAWAASEVDAMQIGLQARSLVNALIGTSTLGVIVYRVEETLGPRQLDDPETGTPRVLSTQSLLIRADEAIR